MRMGVLGGRGQDDDRGSMERLEGMIRVLGSESLYWGVVGVWKVGNLKS